jgi:hypothetical protein
VEAAAVLEVEDRLPVLEVEAVEVEDRLLDREDLDQEDRLLDQEDRLLDREDRVPAEVAAAVPEDREAVDPVYMAFKV